MDTFNPAPSHAAQSQSNNEADASPSYPKLLPPLFSIGGKCAEPLVIVAELQAHLRILGAFASLHQNVLDAARDKGEDQDAAWAVYLARAAYRFQIWALQPLAAVSDQLILPPLDILMVWHSYLLVRIAQQALCTGLKYPCRIQDLTMKTRFEAAIRSPRANRFPFMTSQRISTPFQCSHMLLQRSA